MSIRHANHTQFTLYLFYSSLLIIKCFWVLNRTVQEYIFAKYQNSQIKLESDPGNKQINIYTYICEYECVVYMHEQIRKSKSWYYIIHKTAKFKIFLGVTAKNNENTVIILLAM